MIPFILTLIKALCRLVTLFALFFAALCVLLGLVASGGDK